LVNGLPKKIRQFYDNLEMYGVTASTIAFLFGVNPSLEAVWTGIKNPEDLKKKISLSHEVFEQTIPKVMAASSRSTLEGFSK